MARQSDLWKKVGLGQLLMVGINGQELDDFTKKLIKEYGVNKFIIFSRNTSKGPQKLLKLCMELKTLCKTNGLSSQISIDQEGGPVRRLLPPLYKDMISQDQVTKSNDPLKQIEKMVNECVSILRPFKIDINLAPVLDLPLSGIQHVLRGRCIGKNLQEVCQNGSYYIQLMQGQGILCVAKHFPGIGRVKLDPHFDLPVVSEEKKQILKEMEPFKAAIKEGVYGIMTSHVIYEKIDPNTPATFSYEIATVLLRKKLFFKGPLLSDDLEMKGILKKTSIKKAAIYALNAGHDILLVCKNKKNICNVLDGLMEAYKRGEIKKERIEEAIYRQNLFIN